VELARSELLEDAPFLLRLCETLADKERENAIRLSQVSGFPLAHRLAGFLLSNQQNGRVALKKTVIAESLGVSYRHLEKVMGDFVREGILDKNGRIYEIRGRERLEELAASLRIL
jgi:CRP-like cAMP-binding protein